ncbi:MAG TPA: DUF885 family protein [Gemmatimonas sp.]|nr:DUF885 family protein [Gemmatimonas sp.]
MASVPKLATVSGTRVSELAEVVERFSADQGVLNRRYDASDSPAQRARMRAFYGAWRDRLAEYDFNRLSQEGKVDFVLLNDQVQYALELAVRSDKQRAETAALLPFRDKLLALHDGRRDLVTIEPATIARTLSTTTREIDSLRARIEAQRGRDSSTGLARTIANRAAENVDALKSTLGSWNRFYAGFDPMFTWWVANPYQKLDESLTRYAATIRTRLVGLPATGGGAAVAAGAAAGGRGGVGAGAGAGAANANTNTGANSGPIIGDPVGADGLAADLKHSMIPYTPEELIAIAEREYAFSLSEAKKAAREMGFGDDWKAAMEKVKDTFVEPGKQPDLIRDLARQAEEFFDQHDWVTIPALAREDWRMEMMSPDRQRVNPFFLGGDMIQVSYPTADMTDDEKLMSLRGNNPHFSKAVVFHELNPGHHLQGFMQARYNSHRRSFSTPFWNEGQALYWEMFLWDNDFHVTPEDRMGALFWRMHRSARIMFSLNFHLGKMSPEQAIQFLVDTVNFERANAEGEVRRSFNGTYSPLYQAAYMLGGLQLRALYAETVGAKKMSTREFHDAVLQGGPMPIAMVRARLLKLPLTREGAAAWRFADKLPPPRPFPTRKSMN